MKRRIAVPLFAVVMLTCAAGIARADEDRRIPYYELNRKTVITGPLASPLGAVMELVVRKIEVNEKSGATNVMVLAVNGKSLDAPVRMRYRMIIAGDKMAPGKTYRVKAYQDGAFTGTPSAVLKEVMFQTADYRFEVVLVLFRFLP